MDLSSQVKELETWDFWRHLFIKWSWWVNSTSFHFFNFTVSLTTLACFLHSRVVITLTSLTELWDHILIGSGAVQTELWVNFQGLSIEPRGGRLWHFFCHDDSLGLVLMRPGYRVPLMGQLTWCRGKFIFLPRTGYFFRKPVLMDFDEPSILATNFLEN